MRKTCGSTFSGHHAQNLIVKRRKVLYTGPSSARFFLATLIESLNESFLEKLRLQRVKLEASSDGRFTPKSNLKWFCAKDVVVRKSSSSDSDN